MIAIVAIPAEDDPVWKFSSEKVPHLTLMVLGELSEVNRVAGFVGHAADTSLSRFYLDVERRGKLGEQSADVLFFGKYGQQRLIDFRQHLLTDTDIFTAYNSVEQFPTWIPHLTMGFPETPAKPDTRDYPGIHAVRFDRIALWTGDYEGVEFPLKTENDELSMADKGREFLEHYGVKGMKWGVIRDRGKAAGTAYKKLTVSDDAVAAKKVKGKAKVVGVDALTNKDLQTVITRMNLEMQYSQLKKVEHEQSLLGKGKKWAGNFVSDVLKDAAASWLKRPGSNFSGRTSGRARNFGGGSVIDGSFTPAAIGS